MDTRRGHDTQRTLSIGRATLTIEHVFDAYGYDGLDYLGTFSDYRIPAGSGEKLVHRSTGYVMDHHRIWRDERGRIVQVPDWSGRYREYQFTFHANGHDKLQYALRDSRRLEAYERGDWYCMGVVATVTLDGAEIGRASTWGVESDGGESYVQEIERDEVHEALMEARAWRTRNLVPA